MNLLIVTPYFMPAWGFGGPVRSVWNLARGLVHAGAEVEVVTTDAAPSGKVEVPSVRMEEGICIRTFPRLFCKIPKINTYYYSPGLSSYLEGRIPAATVVHAQGLYVFPTYVSARKCKKYDIPFLVSPRGSLGRWGLRQKFVKKQVYIALVEKRSLGSSATVHYTLPIERDEAPDWAKALPHIVVPNGVGFDLLSDGREFREKHGLGVEEFVVGMVGRIHPKKGIDIFLEAAAKVVGERPLRLVIVGDGEPNDVRETREKVKRLGLERNVTFTGLLSSKDVVDAYAAIDLLALPSEEENFGNVVVEALAQNTPVAVSPNVGLASWVLEKGVGHVIPQDPGAWAAFLKTLPEKRPAKENRCRPIAQGCFDYRIVGQRMHEAYREMVSRRRRS